MFWHVFRTTYFFGRKYLYDDFVTRRADRDASPYWIYYPVYMNKIIKLLLDTVLSTVQYRKKISNILVVLVKVTPLLQRKTSTSEAESESEAFFLYFVHVKSNLTFVVVVLTPYCLLPSSSYSVVILIDIWHNYIAYWSIFGFVKYICVLTSTALKKYLSPWWCLVLHPFFLSPCLFIHHLLPNS